VVYTCTVTNDASGDGSAISTVTVEDDLAGTATYVNGDDGNDGLLEVGEFWVYTASHTIEPDAPDPLVTTVTATGVDMDGDPVPDAEDSHSLDVAYAPAIEVVKDGPTAAEVGDTVVYTFTVTNDDAAGDGSEISTVTVEDDVAGPVTYVSGDDGNDGLLEVGEFWVYTASHTIEPDAPDPLVTTVTASGVDQDGDSVSDTATHRLGLGFTPAIHVMKEGPASANVGDTVVYTFTVANDDATGDGSEITTVTVEDDVAGKAIYVSGDVGDDGLLEVGETWVYTASYTIQLDDPNPLVNTVTVSGLDWDGDGVPEASATHATTIGRRIFLPLVTAWGLATGNF
jgi:hypothetical protein